MPLITLTLKWQSFLPRLTSYLLRKRKYRTYQVLCFLCEQGSYSILYRQMTLVILRPFFLWKYHINTINTEGKCLEKATFWIKQFSTSRPIYITLKVLSWSRIALPILKLHLNSRNDLHWAPHEYSCRAVGSKPLWFFFTSDCM